MNEKRIIQIIISLFGLLLIIGHMIWPNLKVDSVSVILFAIIIIPWLAPVFKTLEFPGGVKLEYNLEKVTKKLEQSGLISVSHLDKKEVKHSKYSFMNVVNLDSELALTGLRMEIESRLKDLAENNSIPITNYSIVNLTKKLKQKGVLSEEETSAILDVLPILNKAAHGGKIEKDVHEWAMNIGPQLLDKLESKIGEQKLPTLITVYKNRDGAQGIEIGSELSKKLIQSTKPFFALMKENESIFYEWLDYLQTSTFTIFESQDEIDELLCHAKYSKLKELMIEKTEQYLKENKTDKLAKELLNKLETMEIRSIW